MSASATTGASGRYASAIFDLGKDSNALDALENDLGQMKSAVAGNADLAYLMESPAFSRDDQQKALAAVMDKMGVSDLTKRFVGLMIAKGRLAMLPGAIEGFQQRLADHRGEVVAEVTSAQPLSDGQRDKLAENLKAAYGKDVKIDASVDPSLLGGLVVKIGSKMIDTSLRAKLSGLQRAMKAS